MFRPSHFDPNESGARLMAQVIFGVLVEVL